MRSEACRRTALLTALTLCLALMLSACEEKMTVFDATVYVKGVLDEAYLGSAEAKYLSLADITVDDVAQAHSDSLDQEYTRFTYQFGLDNSLLTDETRAEIRALLAELCNKASYAVQPAVALDDTRYAVEVAVRPMDLFLQVRQDELASFTAAFAETYADVAPDELSAEELAQLESERANAWASGILKLCQDKLGLLGYGDVEHLLVLVYPDDDGYYTMSSYDFSNLCALVLPY